MATSTPGQCALFAVLAAASLMGAPGAGAAHPTNTFVLAAAQGYGVEDCLAEGGECGRVLADAWCAAHGEGGAVGFGRSTARRLEGEAPYFITCGD